MIKLEDISEMLRIGVNWLLAVAVSYSVGATLFVRSMTLDIDALKVSYASANSDLIQIRDRQNKVEVDVVKSVEGFRGDLIGLQTEVRLMRQDLKKTK